MNKLCTYRNFSKFSERFVNFHPHLQSAPECYYDLPRLKDRTKYTYDYQETTYKSMIPEENVFYSFDPMEKRLPGKLYESSLISSID